VNLALKTVKGMIWAYAAFFGGRLLTLVSTAILARVLVPQDFGIIGFALLILNFIEATRAMGINDALIYNTEDVNEAADTAFVINIAIGCIQFLIVVALAPFSTRFIEDPHIVDVVRIMALAFICNGIGQTYDALLQKELAFKRRFVPDLISTLIKGAISIVLALLGLGVWSLVIGHVVGAFIRSIAVWLILDWSPRLRFYTSKARELWSYGMNIFFMNTLSIAIDQADPLMVGLLLGELQLGYYTVASKIPELVILNIGVVLTRVIFPTYVKIKHDRELLTRSFMITTKYTTFATIGIGLGMSAVAPEMMRLVYGGKWDAAIVLAHVLPLLGMVSTLAWNAGDVFKAIGRPDIQMKLMVLEVLYTFGLIYLFAAPTHLAVMVAIGNLIAFIISAVLRLGLLCHYLKLHPRRLVEVYRSQFLAGAAMFIVVTLWRIVADPLSNIAVLLSSVLLGAIVYLTIFCVLERNNELKEIVPMIRTLLSRRATPVGISTATANVDA
jgi:O-antigen/teichoic acid export membrane protein